MDKRLKEWIIQKNESSTPKEMEAFLRMLKFDPKGILDIIYVSLNRWGHACSRELGIVVDFSNTRENRHDLLHAFQDFYAERLKAISEPKTTNGREW